MLALAFAAVAWLAIPLLYGAAYLGAVPLTLALLLDAATLGLGIAAGPIFPDLRPDRFADPDQHRDPGGRAAGDVRPGQGRPGPLGAALGYGAMILASRLVSYVQCLRIIGPNARRDRAQATPIHGRRLQHAGRRRDRGGPPVDGAAGSAGTWRC